MAPVAARTTDVPGGHTATDPDRQCGRRAGITGIPGETHADRGQEYGVKPTSGTAAARPDRRDSGGSARGPQLIKRDSLLAALDRAAAGKVTIIAAPAGSGKTSLLRTWARHLDPTSRLAMVQVQRDLHDAQPFWLALLNAVCDLSATPSGANPAAALGFSGEALANRILAELADQGERVILAIDDVHELTSSDTLSDLTHLLINLPPGAHVILATRRDLPLRLHKLRLTGELAELRAADLRFTEQETRELLAASRIALSDRSISMLYQRTEGWAAGLRLAAISLDDHPDPERFVAEFTGSSRTIAEYLIAEMLERQPDEVQDLLLRTSILERVNGELADLLTGRPGGEGILLDLEEANAFVVSLDPQRTWFRYHQLFVDLLRLELRRKLPGEVKALHRQAAGWFAGQDRIVEAVRHNQAAADWSRAAELLADHSFGMMLDGQEETVQVLLRAFPQRAGTDHPELCVVHAMVELAHGCLEDATRRLKAAEACLESVPAHRRPRLRAAISSLKLSLARRNGDLTAVTRHAEFLTSSVGGTLDEDMALGSDLRVLALMNLGSIEAWSLKLSDAERHLQEGAELARRIGRPYLEVACLAQYGFAAKLTSFTYSRQHCEKTIALAEQHGWGTAPILAPALVALACSMAWVGEFADAEHRIQQAEEALKHDSGPGIRTLLHLVKGMVHAGRNRLREAYAEFATAMDLQSRFADPHALTGYVTGWTLATRARLGMAAEARAALKELDAPLADSGELRNAHATIRLAEGDPARARTAVEPVIDGRAPAIHLATVVEAYLLSALAHSELGNENKALGAVEQALALAEPERLILPFLMTGAGRLLETAGHRRTSAHAALLADVLDAVHASNGAGTRPPPTADHMLSPTELRVLRYLPTNLSRAEIASELFISINTVNTHVRSIYAKLHATGRSKAVQRAREMRLLTGDPSTP
jgi:LuxR family transcriptional regulator, maltose regulon positive regulatory protein